MTNPIDDMEKAWQEYQVKAKIASWNKYNSSDLRKAFKAGYQAKAQESEWVKIEDMPEEWKEEGKKIMVWGWPSYAAMDYGGKDKHKVVEMAKWNELMGRPYGFSCNTHFTITHVRLPPSPPKETQ